MHYDNSSDMPLTRRMSRYYKRVAVRHWYEKSYFTKGSYPARFLHILALFSRFNKCNFRTLASCPALVLWKYLALGLRPGE